MKPDPTTPQSFIEAAMHAMKVGDRRTARRYAEQAAALAPQAEQPWLLLAYLASPKAAQYYLDRALQVNPTSSRVLAAQEWLQKKSVPDAQPTGVNLPGKTGLPVSKQPGTTRRGLPRWSIWIVGLGVILVGLAALLSWLSAPGGAASQALGQNTTPVKGVQTRLSTGSSPTARPTATIASSTTPTATRMASPTPIATASTTATLIISPTPTPTVLATATLETSPTPTPTVLASPTLAASPTPTTPVSTSTPAATQAPQKNTPVSSSFYTVRPGDTLNLIALRYNIPMQSLIVANNLANPSFIRVGQVLTIPGAGQSPAAATAVPVVPGPTGQGKEIVVDISEQHLYAYQNNQLVFSFVASTGIGNSTRIGTFKVLDKIPRAYSSAFNIWMPYWMGIYYSGTLENGIHGLPLLMNGVELWGNLLGRPATYGCIESKTSEIKQLYDWAEIGTPVIIRR
jgi:LysM repeat protein